jgi:hypothetical protein
MNLADSFLSFLHEADTEDNPDIKETKDPKDKKDAAADNADNAEADDGANPDDNPDTEADPTIDDGTGDNPDDNNSEDGLDNPDDNTDNNGLSDQDVVGQTDSGENKKKLYISDRFDEIYMSLNATQSFLSNIFLSVDYDKSTEGIIKSLSQKVDFNMTNIKEIIEGDSLILFDFNTLKKIFDIYYEDLKNINELMKIVTKNIKNDNKKG